MWLKYNLGFRELVLYLFLYCLYVRMPSRLLRNFKRLLESPLELLPRRAVVCRVPSPHGRTRQEVIQSFMCCGYFSISFSSNHRDGFEIFDLKRKVSSSHCHLFGWGKVFLSCQHFFFWKSVWTPHHLFKLLPF